MDLGRSERLTLPMTEPAEALVMRNLADTFWSPSAASEPAESRPPFTPGEPSSSPATVSAARFSPSSPL